MTTYAERVRELEAEGLTTSDAQGVADAERMTPLRTAIQLVRAAHPGGHFYPYTLAGSRHARTRAQVLGLLLGRKVTQQEAGVTALERAFFERAGDAVTGDCLAARLDSLAEWARAEWRAAFD